MREFEVAIREINTEIEQANTQIRIAHAAIGQWVASRHVDGGAGLPETAELSTALAQHDTVTAQIGEYDAMVETIRRLAEQRTESTTRSKALKQELERIRQESTEMLRAIGETSFTVFRENPLVDQEYADIFAALLENFELIRDLDRQIESKQQQIEERQFLDRVVERGRLLLLRNRRASLTNRAPRLQVDAGKAIVETPFVDAIDDRRLSEIAEPYRMTRKRIAEIEEELAGISEQIDEINAELETLAAQRNPDRRAAELRDAQAKTVASLQEIYADLGSVFLAADGELPHTHQDTRATIDRLTEENQARRERIKRLSAAIQVYQLNEKLASLERETQRRRDSIAKLESEITDLEHERERVESDRMAAEAERGDLSDLGVS